MINSLAKLLTLLLITIVVFIWTGEAQAQKKVRFAYPSSADMGDIPSLLAWEQLKKQGIEMVPTFFPKTELAVQAVAAGEADIGSAAGIAVIKAVESGMRSVSSANRCATSGSSSLPYRSKIRNNWMANGSVITRRLQLPKHWSNGWRNITRFRPIG